VPLVVFHTGKVCTISPWKFPEIHTGIFGRMEGPEYTVTNLVTNEILLRKIHVTKLLKQAMHNETLSNVGTYCVTTNVFPG